MRSDAILHSSNPVARGRRTLPHIDNLHGSGSRSHRMHTPTARNSSLLVRDSRFNTSFRYTVLNMQRFACWRPALATAPDHAQHRLPRLVTTRVRCGCCSALERQDFNKCAKARQGADLTHLARVARPRPHTMNLSPVRLAVCSFMSHQRLCSGAAPPSCLRPTSVWRWTESAP